MSDTARRLAEGKHPWQGHGGSYDRETDLKRTAFLAGWDAAIEHAAKVPDRSIFVGSDETGYYKREFPGGHLIATAIRAERSDR